MVVKGCITSPNGFSLDQNQLVVDLHVAQLKAIPCLGSMSSETLETFLMQSFERLEKDFNPLVILVQS